MKISAATTILLLSFSTSLSRASGSKSQAPKLMVTSPSRSLRGGWRDNNKRNTIRQSQDVNQKGTTRTMHRVLESAWDWIKGAADTLETGVSDAKDWVDTNVIGEGTPLEAMNTYALPEELITDAVSDDADTVLDGASGLADEAETNGVGAAASSVMNDVGCKLTANCVGAGLDQYEESSTQKASNKVGGLVAGNSAVKTYHANKKANSGDTTGSTAEESDASTSAGSDVFETTEAGEIVESVTADLALDAAEVGAA